MFEIYIYGVILSCICVLINYMGYLKDSTTKYPNWLFYTNEIFWQLILIGPLSWIGVILTGISIILRLKNNI